MHWLQSQAHFFYGADGQAERMLGMCSDRGSPAGHFRLLGSKAFYDSCRSGDLPPSALCPACGAAYCTTRFSDCLPSSTAYSARYSAAGPSGLRRRPTTRSSCTAPSPSCLPLFTGHVFLLDDDVKMRQLTFAIATANQDLLGRGHTTNWSDQYAEGEGGCQLLLPTNKQFVPGQCSQGHYLAAERALAEYDDESAVCLQRSDVCSLQPLLAFDDLELNGLALFKRSVALCHNRALMHENVAPALALDEAVALVPVKPFHCSLFFTH